MFSLRLTGFLVVIICLALCTACGPAAPVPSGQPVAEPAPTPVPTLRVGVPFYWFVDQYLVTSLCEASDLLGFQIELLIPIGSTPPTKPDRCDIQIVPNLTGPDGDMCANCCPSCYCAGHSHPDIDLVIPPIDLYLYDTQSVRHALDAGRLAEMPDMPKPMSTTPLVPLATAFTKDVASYGVPAGTAPLLGVANRQLLSQAGLEAEELRGDWTWSRAVDVLEELDTKGGWGAILPADLSLAVAACQSWLGPNCSEQDMFSGNTFNAMLDFHSEYGNILSHATVIAEPVDIGELLDLFIREEAPLVVTRSWLPLALAAPESIVILPFPKGEYEGGAAMGFGWVVPAKSEQQSNAWKLADSLAQNDNMQRWALAHGMLPGTEEGLGKVLNPNSDIAKEVLPRTLLNRENELLALRKIAQQSTAWQIPSNVDLNAYQDFIREGNALIPTLISLSKSGTFSDSIQLLNSLNDSAGRVSQ